MSGAFYFQESQMIKNITIENFKAFGKAETIDFANLTLYSGLNSSGKSSIYQALLLLSQSHGKTRVINGTEIPILVINGEKLQIGKKDELLHNPQNKEVKFHILWNDESTLALEFILTSEDNKDHEDFLLKKMRVTYPNEREYELNLNLNSKKWQIKATSVLEFQPVMLGRIFDAHLREIDGAKSEEIYRSTVVFEEIEIVNFIGYELFSFYIKLEDVVNCVSESRKDKFSVDRIKELYRKEEGKDFTDRLVTLTNNFKFSPTNRFILEGLVDIPPFRGLPRRFYMEGLHANPLLKLSRNKDEKISFRFDYEKNKAVEGTLQNALKYWVSDFFKFADDIEVKELIPDYTSEILLVFKNKKIPINNMGFGISQILPVIFNLLQGENSNLYIVDEPEIHLHPEVQSKLADFFVQMALLNKNIILETHSEYLINRLIFLSIKHSQANKNLKMYWVEKGEEGSSAREIKYDEFGYLISPPEGFLTVTESTTSEINSFRLSKITK